MPYDERLFMEFEFRLSNRINHLYTTTLMALTLGRSYDECLEEFNKRYHKTLREVLDTIHDFCPNLKAEDTAHQCMDELERIEGVIAKYGRFLDIDMPFALLDPSTRHRYPELLDEYTRRTNKRLLVRGRSNNQILKQCFAEGRIYG